MLQIMNFDQGIKDFEENFTKRKEDIAAENEFSSSRITKRFKTDYQFKCKGCEEQFKFNQEV